MASYEISKDGRTGPVLLASCQGDQDTGGGLFVFDGSSVTAVDRLSSGGLWADSQQFARMLRSPVLEDGLAEMLVYDENGVRRYLRIDGLSDPHDILWDGEQFIIASTNTNRLVWVSAAGDVLRHWQAPGRGDAWHLNGLLVHGGRLYVSAFGRGEKHRGWSESLYEPRGMTFDFQTGRDVITGLCCPHHPRVIDGRWLVCNSMLNEVLLHDSDGAVIRRVHLDGFTRGVAVTDDYVFIGESGNRKDPRNPRTASVVVVDRKSWDVLDRFFLPCREVYDLTIVSPQLLAGVRRGFRTNSLRQAEHDQLALFHEAGVQPARLWATGDPLPPEACRVTIEAQVPQAWDLESDVDINCIITNRGSALLTTAPPNPVHASYKWLFADGTPVPNSEGLRTRLPKTLIPGEAAPCRLKVRPPAKPGSYILRLTLVQEHVAWFDALHDQNGSSHSVMIRTAVEKGRTEAA